MFLVDLLQEGQDIMNYKLLWVEMIEDVVVATINTGSLLGSMREVLQAELLSLLEENTSLKVILNFVQVHCVHTPVLGAILVMDKRIKEFQGKWRLCGLTPEVRAPFEETRIDKLLFLDATQEESLSALA